MIYANNFQAVCALCLAILVDRGLISFDDLIISYWPEFGKNGKEKTTVKMLATHEVKQLYMLNFLKMCI